jgi:copper chaperone NosL
MAVNLESVRAALARSRIARPALLVTAALLAVVAIFLPLWKMVLVSIQYPDGLRMIVYPTRIEGDVTEINLLNHYIGMQQISDNLFVELRIIPLLFAAIAVTCLFAALVRRWWVTLPALFLMLGSAAYGFWSMHSRLYQYGHDLDPTAPIDVAPFTPPMLGQNQLAQFATGAYFSWGTYLPILAGLLVTVAFWLDLQRRRAGSF